MYNFLVLPPYSVYPRCAATLLRSCPHPSFLSKRPCRLASVKRKTGAPISDERASALVFYTAHVTRKPQSSPQSLIRTNSYRKLYTYSSSHPISSAAATANSISGCIVVRSKTLLPRLLRYCQTNRPDCGTTTGGNENRQTFSIHTHTRLNICHDPIKTPAGTRHRDTRSCMPKPKRVKCGLYFCLTRSAGQAGKSGLNVVQTAINHSSTIT